jgi:PAS domain-containing protein
MNGKRIRRAPRAKDGSGGTKTRRACRRTAKALRESEGRCRSVFENMAEGVADCRRVRVDGQPTDFVYLAVNEPLEIYTGLYDAVGKRVSEVIPVIRESDSEIF